MCNYSSLSFHVDKTFDIVLKGGEEWGVCKKNFGRENLGVRNPCVQGEGLYPSERKRKKRKKKCAQGFSEFFRVSAWSSGSERVSYEYRELTKS